MNTQLNRCRDYQSRSTAQVGTTKGDKCPKNVRTTNRANKEMSGLPITTKHSKGRDYQVNTQQKFINAGKGGVEQKKSATNVALKNVGTTNRDKSSIAKLKEFVIFLVIIILMSLFFAYYLPDRSFSSIWFVELAMVILGFILGWFYDDIK